MAGAWDDLVAGKADRARARLALGVAAYDQQSYDHGSWLLSGEISLENHPPYAAFGAHVVPASSEGVHTKLIDSRWFDLFVSRLKNLADFQEKKQKLAPRGKAEEKGEEKTPKKTPKGGKGNGKKNEKGSRAEEPASSNPAS